MILYHGTVKGRISGPGATLFRRDETKRFQEIRARGLPSNQGAFAVVAPIDLTKIEACYMTWLPEQAIDWANNLHEGKEISIWSVRYDPNAWAEIHINGCWTCDGPDFRPQHGQSWIACRGYEIEEKVKSIEARCGLYEEIRFFGRAEVIREIKI